MASFDDIVRAAKVSRATLQAQIDKLDRVIALSEQPDRKTKKGRKPVSPLKGRKLSAEHIAKVINGRKAAKARREMLSAPETPASEHVTIAEA